MQGRVLFLFSHDKLGNSAQPHKLLIPLPTK